MMDLHKAIEMRAAEELEEPKSYPLKVRYDAPRMNYCLWDYDRETGFHTTECKNKYFFDLGRNRDVKFKYCPFCGGTITAM